MKIGFCTGLDRITAPQTQKFDYIEPSLNGLREIDIGKIREYAALAKEYGVKVGCFNCSLKKCDIMGAVPADEPMAVYLEDVLQKASILGAHEVVLGSGSSRNISDDIDLDLQLERYRDFVRLYSYIAGKYGIRIAIEPLNKGETNFINTVGQCLDFAQSMKLENVGVLADYYHMCVENEGVEIFESVGDLLWHVHIANPNGRTYPASGDGCDYHGLFNALKKIGYDGGISVEARGDFETQSVDSVEFLKSYL